MREGLERLAGARAAVIGLGARGSVIAQALCRSGLGYLRLVDRDYVREGELQGGELYDEADAREGLPKAVAAASRLRAMDLGIEIEELVSDLDSTNAERLVEGVDVVVDGSDNYLARFIVNDACHKLGLPWVYGSTLMDQGSTMNILQGQGPCLRCLMRELPAPGSLPGGATAGLFPMAPAFMGSIEAAEALKIILKSPLVRRSCLSAGLWEFSIVERQVEVDPECPCCGRGRHDFLEASRDALVVNLCGKDSYQVSPAEGFELDFELLSERLRPLGKVISNGFILIFQSEEREIRLFQDGRAIISRARDAGEAKSLYSRFIGL